MTIPVSNYETVRRIDVDEHRTHCAYQYWKDEFSDIPYLLSKVTTIERELGREFTRSQLVGFYQKTEVALETKFIAAMNGTKLSP